MRYYKRLNVYKASNVLVDEKRDAWSYGWWKFYDAATGVFNYSRYSTTTSGHQSKVFTLLRKKGLPINLVLYGTTESLTKLSDALELEAQAYKKAAAQWQAKLDKLKKKDGRNGRLYAARVQAAKARLYKVETFRIKQGGVM